MQFDFETIMDRTGTGAIAVDVIPFQLEPEGDADSPIRPGFSRLPMWIADMNFATAPSILEAIHTRVDHPAFGYFRPSDAYYQSIINWQRSRNGVDGLTQAEIGYENGVLGCVVSAMQAFTVPGEAVLVHSPTYVGFTGILNGNGRKIVHSELKRDEQGVWRMDYEDMDKKIRENNIHFAIFCNPHNPTGRVWSAEEINAAMEVYRKNDVIVVSDEIWSDLILNGNHHTPTQSVSEDAKNRTIAVYAPSKTFNLAGLIGSYHIIYNSYLRDRVRKQSALCHYNDMNVLSMHALIGAYSDTGAAWVDELRQVLSQNVNDVCDYIAAHFDGVSVFRPEGTYMLFLDCEQWCKTHGKTMDELQHAGIRVGVIWQDGRAFGGDWTIRMNLALPHSQAMEAMRRLDAYVFNG